MILKEGWCGSQKYITNPIKKHRPVNVIEVGCGLN